MRGRCRLPGVSLDSRRLTSAVLTVGITTALLLSVGTRALASGATNAVSPTGTVAGQGYGYWLERSWQASFSTSPPVNPCKTLTANGQRVADLTLTSPTASPGTYAYTCTEPAGRPIYVVQVSSECSTFKGDHPGYGTTAVDLKRCARAGFQGPPQETTTVDGRSVDLGKLIAGTGVYPVHVSEKNIVNAKPGSGRSAAYGYGLLLSGFSNGTHTIHSVVNLGTSHWDITFTVHIH